MNNLHSSPPRFQFESKTTPSKKIFFLDFVEIENTDSVGHNQKLSHTILEAIEVFMSNWGFSSSSSSSFLVGCLTFKLNYYFQKSAVLFQLQFIRLSKDRQTDRQSYAADTWGWMTGQLDRHSRTDVWSNE